MGDITLKRVTLNDRELLSNLLQLYIHDMSEYFDVQLDAKGRYDYEPLLLYFSNDDRHTAYLIYRASELAGFALVARGSPAKQNPNALDMSEFFILRSQRRHGTGREAAIKLWGTMPGEWVVRVSDKNRPALPFWESTIRAFTQDQYSIDTMQGKSSRFQVFSFNTLASNA